MDNEKAISFNGVDTQTLSTVFSSMQRHTLRQVFGMANTAAKKYAALYHQQLMR
jgi:hypothetical protein